MTSSCLQRAQEYLLQPKTNLDIHSSTLTCVSRSALVKFRLFAWIIMTIVLVLLERVSPSLFINVKFLSDEGLILTWLYFALVTQDYWINGGSDEGRKTVCPKIKFIVEMIFELALCFEVPITVIEWSAMFEEQLKTESDQQILVEILEHSTPFILLVIDMTCNSYRFATRKLIFIIGYLLTYLLVNLSYSVTVEPVYDIITWLDGISYVYALAVAILSIGTQLICRKIFTKFKETDPKSNNFVDLSRNQRRSDKQMKSDEDNMNSN